MQSEKNRSASVDEIEHASPNEKAVLEHHGDVLADQEILAEAYRAETGEHQMRMWEAVKMYPMACFWAFIFGSTIVSWLGFEV